MLALLAELEKFAKLCQEAAVKKLRLLDPELVAADEIAMQFQSSKKEEDSEMKSQLEDHPKTSESGWIKKQQELSIFPDVSTTVRFRDGGERTISVCRITVTTRA